MRKLIAVIAAVLALQMGPVGLATASARADQGNPRICRSVWLPSKVQRFALAAWGTTLSGTLTIVENAVNGPRDRVGWDRVERITTYSVHGDFRQYYQTGVYRGRVLVFACLSTAADDAELGLSVLLRTGGVKKV